MKLNKKNKDGSINAYYENNKPGFGYTVSNDHPLFKEQIEENIWPAVATLVGKGYKTVTSCQGHSKEDYDKGKAIRYNGGPQVTIYFESEEEATNFINNFKNDEVKASYNTTMNSRNYVTIYCRAYKITNEEACDLIYEKIKQL